MEMFAYNASLQNQLTGKSLNSNNALIVLRKVCNRMLNEALECFLNHSSGIQLVISGHIIWREFLIHLCWRTEGIKSAHQLRSYLFFFLTSLLEYNCFTIVCQSLLYNKVNQLYIYIYPHISSLLRPKNKAGSSIKSVDQFLIG